MRARARRDRSVLVAGAFGYLWGCLPEIGSRVMSLARLLLRGPVTLVLPNPAGRFRWLTGTNPEAIGVRVPDFDGPGAEVLVAIGVLVATSANHPGGPDPKRLDEGPEDIRQGAAGPGDRGGVSRRPSTGL